jgi:hypothetical protein
MMPAWRHVPSKCCGPIVLSEPIVLGPGDSLVGDGPGSFLIQGPDMNADDPLLKFAAGHDGVPGASNVGTPKPPPKTYFTGGHGPLSSHPAALQAGGGSAADGSVLHWPRAIVNGVSREDVRIVLDSGRIVGFTYSDPYMRRTVSIDPRRMVNLRGRTAPESRRVEIDYDEGPPGQWPQMAAEKPPDTSAYDALMSKLGATAAFNVKATLDKVGAGVLGDAPAAPKSSLLAAFARPAVPDAPVAAKFAAKKVIRNRVLIIDDHDD